MTGTTAFLSKLLSYSIVTIDEIRELIQLVSETGVAELEVQRGENRVRIRRSFGTDVYEAAAPALPHAAVLPREFSSELVQP